MSKWNRWRRSSAMLRVSACLLLCLPSLVLAQAKPVPATSDDASRSSRAHFSKGLALAREQRWADALVEFDAAWDAQPRPSIAFNIASTRYRLGQYVKARAALDDYLRIARAGDPDLEAASQLRDQVMGHIATVKLTVAPDDARVWLDGALVPGAGAERRLEIDPGKHRIRITLEHHDARDQQLQAAPGQPLELRVGLQRSSVKTTAAPWYARPWTWVAAGAVVVVATSLSVALATATPDPLQSSGGSARAVLVAQ